jgi:RimJ/RimL family protein N-acetyltransferase
MDVSAVTLVGEGVRLEPLAARHAADLCAAGDEQLFLYLFDPPPRWDEPGLADYIARALAAKNRVAFAIVDLRSARAVGSTSFMDIRPEHRGLEIGSTWLGRAAQGTHVNPQAKLLVLRHAFETLGCVRVQLKTDARNLQSQAAMLKLGCVREGLLRRHMILPDGFVRDTVMFSILDSEWPQVRARLEARCRVQ